MRRVCLAALLAAGLLSGCMGSGGDRSADVAPAPTSQASTLLTVPGPAPAVAARQYSAIVVDARSGRVLHESDARGLRYPASLTKMMTLYMLFEAIDAGRLSRSTELAVSEEAASRPPSKLYLKEGTTVTVDTAARALAVRSANDVAVVVAENLAGSEAAFARAMTAKARSIGMQNTVFRNASGLPDDAQYTTARDMAVLGRALSDRFPRWFGYFSTREITYNGRTWKNTNRLLTTVRGMNGIKTGYIRKSGSNLVASVKRDGRHIIAVVIGGKTRAERDKRMTTLIDTYLPKASRGGLFAFAAR